MKTALITGISGQDGSYLSELLLGKGYRVVGILRRHSVTENQTSRIDSIIENKNLILEYGDLMDVPSLISVLDRYKPNEIYHLAAQSHVGISFSQPIFTANVTGIGTLNLLEAIRISGIDCRMYNAGSSEMFGNSIDEDGFQRETTPLNPVSPYGCSKVFSYNICKNYRNAYGMFISTGILFNHESPRRGLNFVTNKVAKAVADIYNKKSTDLILGNLMSSRDWGHSKDYVMAMYMMLQSDSSDDFVCSTGESHSIKDLCEVSFSYLGLNWEDYVKSDSKFMRAEELDFLKGDSTKLRTKLGWSPKYTFEQMMHEMIDHWNNS